MATYSSVLAWEIPQRSLAGYSCGVAQNRTWLRRTRTRKELLADTLFEFPSFPINVLCVDQIHLFLILHIVRSLVYSNLGQCLSFLLWSLWKSTRQAFCTVFLSLGLSHAFSWLEQGCVFLAVTLQRCCVSFSGHHTQGVDNGFPVIAALITWLKFLHCKVTVFSFCN